MPDTHNTRNFMAHGGSELVIGGKLTILDGAEVTGLADAEQLVPATEDALGCVKAAAKSETETVPVKIGPDGTLYVPACPAAANQAASTATTVAALKDDFNTLLAALKTVGLMEADEEPDDGDDNGSDGGGENGGSGGGTA